MLSVIYPDSIEDILSSCRELDSDIHYDLSEKKALIEGGTYKLAVLVDERMEPFGFTVFTELKDANLVTVFEDIEEPDDYTKYCNYVQTDMKNHIFIDWFSVGKNYQNSGYGRFFFNQVYGGKNVLLYSVYDAIEFWEKMGFNNFFYEEYHMEKQVNPLVEKIRKAFDSLEEPGYETSMAFDDAIYSSVYDSPKYATVMGKTEHIKPESTHDSVFIGWRGYANEIIEHLQAEGLKTKWGGQEYLSIEVRL